MTLVEAPVQRRTLVLRAASLEEVAELLEDRDEAGACDFELTGEYDQVARDGTPRGLRTHLQIMIEMPRWVGRDGATAAEQREWDRFYAALERHEREHELQVRRDAGAADRRLDRVRVSDFEARVAEEIAKIQRAGDAFDRRTDYGRRPPPGTTIRIP